LKDGKFYIGCTSNLADRLYRHTQGWEKSTKHRKPFQLVYKEEFKDKLSGFKREKELKLYKSHKYIEELISNKGV